MKAIIGIDPGQGGGLAVFFPDGRLITYSYKKEGGYSEILREIDSLALAGGYGLRAFVEYLTGVNVGYQMTGRQGFRMGESYGRILGALEALEIPFELVPPQKWQKGICGLSGKKGEERKRALHEAAKQRFPAAKPTRATCDAILIAEYGRKA